MGLELHGLILTVIELDNGPEILAKRDEDKNSI